MKLSCFLCSGRRRWGSTEFSEYLRSNWRSVFSFSVHLPGISGRHFLSWLIGGAVLLQTKPMFLEDRQVHFIYFFILLRILRHGRLERASTGWENLRNNCVTFIRFVTFVSAWPFIYTRLKTLHFTSNFWSLDDQQFLPQTQLRKLRNSNYLDWRNCF